MTDLPTDVEGELLLLATVEESSANAVRDKGIIELLPSIGKILNKIAVAKVKATRGMLVNFPTESHFEEDRLVLLLRTNIILL